MNNNNIPITPIRVLSPYGRFIYVNNKRYKYFVKKGLMESVDRIQNDDGNRHPVEPAETDDFHHGAQRHGASGSS